MTGVAAVGAFMDLYIISTANDSGVHGAFDDRRWRLTVSRYTDDARAVWQCGVCTDGRFSSSHSLTVNR